MLFWLPPIVLKGIIYYYCYILLYQLSAQCHLGIFLMMFILILSFVTRNIINFPLMWIIEMAQFIITGYYLLGGGYSMITGDHVIMDLFYPTYAVQKP